MKLRQLSLHNVRRFANTTARIGPFGDGLTTITAENESGKSTFFDALHALIFESHGTARKEIKSLQPYSGGAMRISADIDLDGRGYRIEKQFNLKKSGSSAVITDLETGQLLKQADEAEQWIETHIAQTHRGPAGLLWVRQGSVGIDAGGKALDTRRDLMSSVRGQIDAVTGGRQMDAILSRCRQDLDEMATKQGRPKTGSAWKVAVDRVATLEEQHDALTADVRKLADHLKQKKTLTTRLAQLSDPDLLAQREAAIKETQAQLTQAQDHDRKLKEADKDLTILRNAGQNTLRAMAEIETRRAKRIALEQTIAEGETALKNLSQAQQTAQNALSKAQTDITAQDEMRKALQRALTQARIDEKQARKQNRLRDLSDLLDRLEQPTQQRAQADKDLSGIEISRTDLARLSELEKRRDIAKETRKSHFGTLRVLADDPAAPAQIDQNAIANDTPVLIDRALSVSLPGFGRIDLTPAQGAGQGIEDPAQLQAALTAELQSLDQATVADAARAVERRETAYHRKQSALAEIRALAPDGRAQLESEYHTLCTELGLDPAQPLPARDPATPPTTEKSEQLEAQIAAHDDALDRARAALPALQQAVSTASTALTEAQVIAQRQRAEAAALAPTPDEAAEYDRLSVEKAAHQSRLTAAETARQALAQAAPDLALVRTAHQRAVQAGQQDQLEIRRLETDLARLNGAIQTQSDGAVEEQLAETNGKLEQARIRAAQFERQARALTLLIDSLEAARAEAQDTYFEPIRQELLPLLRQLHAGAEFQFDPDRLLIDTITRDGVTDRLDALSGGAYEQVAILTRLAFANLFARQGHHVPIILDDALIHTDDGRISTMFTMLAHMAQAQQIIVLSCRTRAFSDLGGERATIQLDT